MIYLNAHYSVIGERYGRPHRRHTAHCAETGRGEEREEEKHYTLRDTCKTAPPRRNVDESALVPSASRPVPFASDDARRYLRRTRVDLPASGAAKRRAGSARAAAARSGTYERA